VAVVGAKKQEATTAQVAGNGMNDGQSKTGGHGCVDSIAARAKDFNTGVGGQMVNTDHHAVLGSDGLLVKIRDHVLRALLSE
jgi:hypothetical protein